MCKSFNREAVIHELYISREMKEALSKMQPVELQEDLRQEMFVVLCKMPEPMLQGLHERGELRWYMVRVMVNMIKTDRSTFFRTFRSRYLAGEGTKGHNLMDGHLTGLSGYNRKEKDFNDFNNSNDDPGAVWREWLYTDPEELDSSDEWSQRISDIVEELDPYEAGLLKLYADMGNSCKPVASATGIPERAIRFAVARAKEKVKTKLRQAC